MAKKSKEPNKNSNPKPDNSSNSNSGNIFKTLFGDTPEDATASSIFSDANPFRRKADGSSQTPPNKQPEKKEKVEKKRQLGLGFDVENDSAESEKRKSKKGKASHFDGQLTGEEIEVSEKLMKGREEEQIVDLTKLSCSKKGKERKGNAGLNSEKTSKKEGQESPDLGLKSKKMAKREGKESPKMGLESKGNGVSENVGVKNEMSEKKKKKKRKRDEIEVEYEKKRYGALVTGEEQNPEGNKEGGVMVGEKRKKMDNPEEFMVSKEGFDDEDKLLRTVFVGNLPLKIKKKVLIREFGKFGEVESVRIRSVPIVDSKTPRKGAIMKKQLNENADSVHAYIVFKTEDSAQASLAHNMAVIGGNHVRVDRACPPRKKLKGDSASLYDNKRTVFVGNLPFDVKDEELYQLFAGMEDLESSIEAIRVIRDPNTSLGKGIAYVLFKTRDATNMVVKRYNLKLRDRELRLSHAKSSSTPSKRKDFSPPGKDVFSSKKFAEDSRTPGSNNKSKVKATMSYQGLRASKSGGPKKSHAKTVKPGDLNSKMQKAQNPTERKRKRPAVAARKAKALKASGALKQSGAKRKLENRTPGSARQKKKARKNQ